MKREDIKPGRRYVIDMAPLIASPEPAGRTFTGVVRHTGELQAYVIPDTNNSPMYIFHRWFIREEQSS